MSEKEKYFRRKNQEAAEQKRRDNAIRREQKAEEKRARLAELRSNSQKYIQ